MISRFSYQLFQLKHLYRMLTSITRTHVSWDSDKDFAATWPLVSSTHGKETLSSFARFHAIRVRIYHCQASSIFAFLVSLGPFIWVELKIRSQLALCVHDGYHLRAPIDNVTSESRTPTQVTDARDRPLQDVAGCCRSITANFFGRKQRKPSLPSIEVLL